MNSLVSNRLNDLYKKYFKNNDFTMGQDFEAVRPQMSNEDYDLSQKLLSYYGQQNVAKNQYEFSNNEIEQQRSKALQQNDIARQKTLKYLPEYQRMQGMGGLGTSESALIATKNSFNNNRNIINADADSKLADLLDRYQVNMNTYDTSYLSDADSIKNKYELARKEDGERIFNSYMNRLDSQKLEFNSVDEIENDYKRDFDKLDESQRSIIESKINYYRNNPVQKEQEETIKNEKLIEENKDIINGEKSFNFKDKTYKISDSNALDESSGEMQLLNKCILEMLGTNNPYSQNIENGTTLDLADLMEMEARKQLRQQGTEYQYDWFMKPGIDSLRASANGKITYYNGKWYKSTRQ